VGSLCKIASPEERVGAGALGGVAVEVGVGVGLGVRAVPVRVAVGGVEGPTRL